MPLPTPDDAPITYTARRLLVPSVLALKDALAGGLSTYIYGGQWFQQGTMSPERAAEALKVSFLSTVYPPAEIGQVAGFLRTGVIDGWLPFDGAVRNRTDYPDLHDVLPNEVKTAQFFTLPTQDSWVLRATPDITPNPLGSVYGANSKTLTLDQMPPHTHGYLYPTAQPLIAGAPESLLTGFTAPAISRTTTSAGQGDPVDVRSRSLAVRFYIYSGVYEVAI